MNTFQMTGRVFLAVALTGLLLAPEAMAQRNGRNRGSGSGGASNRVQANTGGGGQNAFQGRGASGTSGTSSSRRAGAVTSGNRGGGAAISGGTTTRGLSGSNYSGNRNSGSNAGTTSGRFQGNIQQSQNLGPATTGGGTQGGASATYRGFSQGANPSGTTRRGNTGGNFSQGFGDPAPTSGNIAQGNSRSGNSRRGGAVDRQTTSDLGGQLNNATPGRGGRYDRSTDFNNRGNTGAFNGQPTTRRRGTGRLDLDSLDAGGGATEAQLRQFRRNSENNGAATAAQGNQRSRGDRNRGNAVTGSGSDALRTFSGNTQSTGNDDRSRRGGDRQPDSSDFRRRTVGDSLGTGATGRDGDFRNERFDRESASGRTGRDNRRDSRHLTDAERHAAAAHVRNDWDHRNRHRGRDHDRHDVPFRGDWWSHHAHDVHHRRHDHSRFAFDLYLGSHARHHHHVHPYYWWHWAPAPRLSTWVTYNWATPYYWDYGPGQYIHCANNVIYVNGNWFAPAPVYYRQTVLLAQSAPVVTEQQAAQLDWLPLGVFAMVPEGGVASDLLVQLAVTSDGMLGGTVFNQATGASFPLEGMVDGQTQRAAWTYVDEQNQQVTMETGLYNLTKPEATMLVHFGPEQMQVWQLVRLEQPADDGQQPAELPEPAGVIPALPAPVGN